MRGAMYDPKVYMKIRSCCLGARDVAEWYHAHSAIWVMLQLMQQEQTRFQEQFVRNCGDQLLKKP